MRNFENKEKIVQVSGALKIVSFLLMLLLGFGMVTWLFLLLSRIMLPLKHGPTAFTNTNRELVLLFIPGVMEFMVWLNFWNFFSRLREGHLFDAWTVKRLMNAGRWKIAAWFGVLISMWVENKLEARPLGGLLDGLFVGVGIIFTAWLLREGQTMEEEQKLTV